MPIFRLNAEPTFPPPDRAEEDGLLAVGGDLSPARLIEAYRRGIFPWFGEGEPILWWSPDPRLVLDLDDLHVSRSMRKAMRQGKFEGRVDTAFAQVIAACASAPREGQPGTWITAEMQAAYVRLHEMGHAHSYESWCDGELVGGIYGVSIGRGFFGESMFSRRTNASKAALIGLVGLLKARGDWFLDCQVTSQHLLSLGARDVPRRDFLERLGRAVESPNRPGKWAL